MCCNMYPRKLLISFGKWKEENNNNKKDLVWKERMRYRWDGKKARENKKVNVRWNWERGSLYRIPFTEISLLLQSLEDRKTLLGLMPCVRTDYFHYREVGYSPAKYNSSSFPQQLLTKIITLSRSYTTSMRRVFRLLLHTCDSVFVCIQRC